MIGEHVASDKLEGRFRTLFEEFERFVSKQNIQFQLICSSVESMELSLL